MSRTETKHTPGPWRAEIIGASDFAIRAPAPGPNNAFRIATVKHCNGDEVANARLIAAAPDHHANARELDRLCLVIESAVRNAESKPGNVHDVLRLIHANRAAIAKAEGSS